MRDTWVRDAAGLMDVRFFVGLGNEALHGDEVRLGCPDDYMSLPHKTKAILGWSLERGYDFTLLVDTDTYVIPERLEGTGFADYDITGLFNGRIGVPNATEGKYWAWISGGNGYFLSAKAAILVAERPHDGDWAEDRMVGQALGPLIAGDEITAQSHEDYGFHTDGDQWLTRVTSHYCTRGLNRQFDPSWMYKKYRYNILGERNGFRA
jgi:hypothetical protein